MKKILLLMAAAAVMVPVSAQTTYNYFESADCDSEGWLWLDSKEKLSKYCGAGKTKKIQMVQANYEESDPVTQITDYPFPTTSATVKGYNSEGIKGGEGSKTGGIILPKSEATNPQLGDTQYGGGIVFNLPDLAELCIYVSLDYKEFFAVYSGANESVSYTKLPVIKQFYEHNLQSLHSPVPGINYCGAWENIQDVKGYNVVTDQDDLFIKCEPGLPTTVYIANLVEGHEVIVHGVKLRTFTNTTNDSAVEEIAVEEAKDAKTYNLFGVEVDDTYKGIVIRNGKKLLQQ